MDSKVVTTASLVKKKQRGEKIVMLTAYDFSMAKLMDTAGADIILVGDSLGQVVLGYDSTLPVTLADMIHHTKAVVRGTRRALVVVDMPFMSYQVGPGQALQNAGRLVKEAASVTTKPDEGKPASQSVSIAVKLEGGRDAVSTVRRIVDAGIPVMGHIGMQPMSASKFGGARIHGKAEAEAEQILDDARALEEAGVFAMVLEVIPAELAKRVTESVSVPTIGIGAGPHCDGQVLVSYDMLGMYGAPFRHVKQYANLGDEASRAFREYIEEVKSGAFPGSEHSF